MTVDSVKHALIAVNTIEENPLVNTVSRRLWESQCRSLSDYDRKQTMNCYFTNATYPNVIELAIALFALLWYYVQHRGGASKAESLMRTTPRT